MASLSHALVLSRRKEKKKHFGKAGGIRLDLSSFPLVHESFFYFKMKVETAAGMRKKCECHLWCENITLEYDTAPKKYNRIMLGDYLTS